MRTVIIEDETAAAVNLKALLKASYPEMEVVALLESVTDAVEWFNANPAPELVFMDIHLADGNAFKIFNRITIQSPIIFTTAYDQYALEAFKVNSVDYLLKPIAADDLNRAINKLKLLGKQELSDYSDNIAQMARTQNESHTFLVNVRDKIVPLRSEEIAYCHTLNEHVSAYTFDNTTMPMDKTLEAIVSLLPKNSFFRANRQFIISRKAIKDISVWFGSRLAVNLIMETPERIVISKARVPEFKQWLSSGE
ncbi:MAG: response regulator transcription factor [Tidjanibacter sp.]|nr:response regulator transcription factor [Tidjanibacter sp.]